MPCKTIQAEGKEAGISWASIRRAAESIAVVKKKGVGGWYWKLNDRDMAAQHAQEAQHAQPSEVEHLEHLESTNDFGPLHAVSNGTNQGGEHEHLEH